MQGQADLFLELDEAAPPIPLKSRELKRTFRLALLWQFHE